ncbi:TKL/DRK protein kinase [Phytophthora cinnamomi]|uniref:TKL/DRK protein kinase n=1 Tax=Phytophthora cinnamomi TaxID=4785 RepID=UPI00355A3CC9|nr:TKL/DRK protein kinase [Phytophthora cinnamomi]
MASKNSSAGLKLGYVLAPVCAVLVACGLVGLYVYSKRRRREVDESDPLEDSLIDGERFHPQSTKDAPVPNDEFAPNQSSTSTLYSSALTSHGTVDRSTWLRSSGSSFDEDFSSGSNNTLKILLNSDVLVGQRIPYESIYFQQALSKGASGEVWLSEYQGQQVAVKRLLQAKAHSAGKVEEFAKEIELSAGRTSCRSLAWLGTA